MHTSPVNLIKTKVWILNLEISMSKGVCDICGTRTLLLTQSAKENSNILFFTQIK
jgi:hypothetical protein